MAAGSIEWDDASEGAPTLRVSGTWTLTHYLELDRLVTTMLEHVHADAAVDFSHLEAVDTAGAGLLAELLGNERLCMAAKADATLSEERRQLLEVVGHSLAVSCRRPRPRRDGGWLAMLERVGHSVLHVRREGMALLGFIGLSLVTGVRLLPQPRRWRVTSLVHHMEAAGLDAVPIVTLLSFMVGAVIAFLGATVLADFGASVFTIDLVAYSFLREFGVLLAAILLAGRTASAFTAQIGSMKANEEIDAIRTLGLDPMELLVLPRTLALVITLPLLTFLSMIAGILGGAVTCILVLDISPAMFLSVLQADIAVRHLWVGLSKAPVFAFVIAMIGCLEGFRAGSSAESVGRRTTSAVVQSIFTVILFDSLAALFFMEMGW